MLSTIKNLGLELGKSEQKQIKGGLGTPYTGPDYDHKIEDPDLKECDLDLCYIGSPYANHPCCL
ncbi:hypothetical protein [uncultured Tenacibaculum sp.]|uniref:hypothetical protein n=1 Tax=uncultured Tenacibaculum sp. TaxID=174713 RepID=UPI00260E4B50|nr:hypothetical protein [uncultured Tenacibaculum sp.]